MNREGTRTGAAEPALAIEAQGLTRCYGALVAVDHLDLRVSRAELLAFLGPNGAGKTTTIRMLTGLIRPTKGTALIDGLDAGRHPIACKSRVGVVPQRSNLYAELTARDNLIFVAQLYGLPRTEWGRRADELLERFGLSDRAGTGFATLSGGMKRRLTIAAALVHRPPILFLDEPTTGLDVQSARSLRQLIRELREQGMTIFLTTHLVPEAEQLADRVAIIVKGKLVIVDTPAALRAQVQRERVLEVTVSEPTSALLAALGRSAAIGPVSRAGDVLRLVVSSVDEALREVTAAAQRCGACIAAIRSLAPTLEDAFVQLTQVDAEAMRNGGPQRAGEGAR